MKRVASVFSLVIVAAIVLAAVIPVLAGGSIDIAGYCASQGKGAPYNQGPDWYCGGSTWLLSMNEICVWQYGSGAYAVTADRMNPNGWSCEGGSSTSTDSGGSPSGGGGSSGSALNMSGYCSAHGLGTPYTSGRDWFCGGSSFSISPDEVCRWQGGGYAINPDVMNPNGWTCEGSDSPAPVQSNPVPNTGDPVPTAAPQTTTGTTSTSSGTTSSNLYSGSSTPPSSGNYVQVLETSLRVRAFPTTDSQMLGYVRQWDYYPLYEIRGGWGLISGSLGSGWVSLQYVTIYEGGEVQSATAVNPNHDPLDGYDLEPACVAVESAQLRSNVTVEQLARCYESAIVDPSLTTEEAYALAAVMHSCGHAPLAETVEFVFWLRRGQVTMAVSVFSADDVASCVIDFSEFLGLYF